MALSCISVEDRKEDREILLSYIADAEQLSLEGDFDNVTAAREYLNQNKVGLIFCDIMIGDTDGLSFIKSLENCPQVIFTTSFPNFAVTGFELDAADYLVKPYMYKRFLQAVNKAVAKHDLHSIPATGEPGIPAPAGDHFFIRSEHSIIRINYADVIYIEGLKDYIKIITADKTYLTGMHLKVVEDSLPAEFFIRIHRSFIVNIGKIESLNNYELIAAGKSLPLGESYRQNFLKTVVSKKIIAK